MAVLDSIRGIQLRAEQFDAEQPVKIPAETATNQAALTKIFKGEVEGLNVTLINSLKSAYTLSVTHDSITMPQGTNPEQIGFELVGTKNNPLASAKISMIRHADTAETVITLDNGVYIDGLGNQYRINQEKLSKLASEASAKALEQLKSTTDESQDFGDKYANETNEGSKKVNFYVPEETSTTSENRALQSKLKSENNETPVNSLFNIEGNEQELDFSMPNNEQELDVSMPNAGKTIDKRNCVVRFFAKICNAVVGAFKAIGNCFKAVWNYCCHNRALKIEQADEPKKPFERHTNLVPVYENLVDVDLE